MNKDEISELEEILRLQKDLQDIIDSINASQNINQTLADLRPKIKNLFRVESANIYIINRIKKEIYTIIVSDDQLTKHSIPINNHTISGYVAKTGKIVNLADVNDEKNIEINHEDIFLEPDSNDANGVIIKQIMAVPIMYNGELMGTIEIINKIDHDGMFDDEDPVLLQEIVDVLGIALFNQKRKDPASKKTKFSYLVYHDLISEEEVRKVNEEAEIIRDTPENVLIKKYNISKDYVGNSIADFYRCKFISFKPKTAIPSDILKDLNYEYLTRELWVPIGRIEDSIHVIMYDPLDILKLDAIKNVLKTKKIVADVAFKEDIIEYIKYFFKSEAGDDSSINDLLDNIKNQDVDEAINEIDEPENINESDNIIIQLVNKIIRDAVNRGASDIHIEPDVLGKHVLIRYRIDGDCLVHQTLPFSYRSALVSRIKIMSKLNITFRRTPQDGKIAMKIPGQGDVELRVATIPTQGNVEDVVLRVLGKGETLPLKDMSLTSRNYKELVQSCEKPYGLILVVGPTGSGKTTTLHSVLGHINNPDRKIWTAEDPVEITQRGLRQVQVDPKIGFDFASAMRAFLRADPDIIMVGEMRDFETAKIGIEASLTGHLVLSTLHTNSAPETITRLLDIGIDPLNFAVSLICILAQRLVKKLCDKCKEPYRPSIEEYNAIVENYGHDHFKKLNLPYSNKLKLYRPKGCDACERTGYTGRVAIHELLIASDNIKKSIQSRDVIDVLRSTALIEGMNTLYQDGIQKAFQGLTDIKHVHRVCIK